MTHKLDIEWLLLFALSGLLIRSAFGLFRYFGLYKREALQHKKYRTFLLSETLVWTLFILYFLYQFFLRSPYFSTIVLVLIILLLGFIWKDLFSGYLMKLSPDFYPGTRIYFDQKEWNMGKVNYLSTLLTSEQGRKSRIPNRKLIQEKVDFIAHTQEELKIQIPLDAKVIKQYGSWEKLESLLTASPWASAVKHPELQDQGNGMFLLECWAFNGKSKRAYREYIESQLSD